MSNIKIHPTAIIETGAELAEGVEIGPFSIIKKHVKVGKNTKIRERVTVDGWTTIGENCDVFTGAVLGSPTQDKKFTGGKSFLNIGNNNNIREYVTINPGTGEGTATTIGDGNLLMAYSHVAHDCILHNNVTLANVGTLAGHVEVHDKAIIGGLTAIHQFVTVGTLAIIGGCSKATQDIPPFVMVDGHPARAHTLNKVGLQRANVSEEEKRALKKAYKIIFRSKITTKTAIKRIREEIELNPSIETLLLFLENAKRGICD